MGSIFNLLNPLTISSPAPTSSVQSSKRGAATGEGGSEDVIVALDAEVECTTPPVESDEMRATLLARESNEDERMEQGQPSIVVERVADTSSKEDGGRRTSSSPLADILNPVQGTPGTSSTTHIELSSSERVIVEEVNSLSALPLEHIKRESSIASLPINNLDQNDEEMDVDVVGTATEEVATPNIETLNSNIPTALIPPSQPMLPSASTDSQATISDVVEPTPTQNPPIPSRSPTPSRKRKFTPESSPDEPLSAGLPPPGPHPVHLETHTHEQISVEKPQPTPASRAVKKPKRPAQIKRPTHAKKKSAATNGHKKLNRKHTEKSESVGLDEVLSLSPPP